MVGFADPISKITATAPEQPSAAGPAEHTPSGTLSPDPITRMELSDDGIYEIAALLAQAALQDRKSSRQLRDAREKVVEAQTKSRIHSMRERADAVRTAAMVNGLAGMAAGGCQVLGGAAALDQASKIDTGQTGPKLTVNQETGACALGQSNDGAAARASAYTSLGNGASQLVTGTGGLVASGEQHRADNLDASAAAHEAKAQRAEREVGEYSQEMDDATQFMNKVMEFLKDVRGSQNAAAQAALIRG